MSRRGSQDAAAAATAAAKSLQSCPTLCDPIDGSPPGSPIPGILQARTLESVAISFSKAWKWKVKVKSLSCVRLLVTPWTAAHQAPPSMGIFRHEYWSGVPLPSPSQDAREKLYCVPGKGSCSLPESKWPDMNSGWRTGGSGLIWGAFRPRACGSYLVFTPIHATSLLSSFFSIQAPRDWSLHPRCGGGWLSL